MMHSMMKQTDVLNGHAWPIFARSTELWNFQIKLGTGPRDDVTTVFKDFSYWPEI